LVKALNLILGSPRKGDPGMFRQNIFTPSNILHPSRCPTFSLIILSRDIFKRDPVGAKSTLRLHFPGAIADLMALKPK